MLISRAMRRDILGLLLATISLTLLPQAGSAQSVIKLFSTPAERAELERRRLLLARPESVPVEIVRPVEIVELPTLVEEQADVIITLGGSMLRGDGTYTIWINGNPVNQEDLPDYMELLTPFSQGRLRISNQESGRSYEVKPGQVLNLTTGELMESYEVTQMASLPVTEPANAPGPETDEPMTDALLDAAADTATDPSQN